MSIEWALEPLYHRALGWMSYAEIRGAAGKVVAVAGAGGDGHRYADLVRVLPLAEIRVADPDVITDDGLCRVTMATRHDVGQAKVEVFSRYVHDLSPRTRVVPVHEGVTQENVESFVDGCDLVVDEIDLNRPEIAVALYRAAGRRGIPVLTTMNVGFMGLGTSFMPGARASFEWMLGVKPNASLDEIAQKPLDLSRLLPQLPWRYGDLKTFETVTQAAGAAPYPSVLVGVDAAAAIGITQAFLHLAGTRSNRRPQPIWAPRWAYYDAMTNRAGRVTSNRLRFSAQVALIALRNSFKLNPSASYGVEDLRVLGVLEGLK